MNQIAVIGIVIAAIVGGVLAFGGFGSESDESSDSLSSLEPELISTPEEETGRDIQISLNDGITMSTTP